MLMLAAVTPFGSSGAWAMDTSEPERVGVIGAAVDSVVGDVYAEPSRWHPLSLTSFFSEGWDQAWASPVNGSGGAPRQGWIGAADGVFYRLGIGTYSYAHDIGDNGDQHAGAFTLYTPLSRRFEIRQDIPIVVNNKGSGSTYNPNFGDYTITPRVILSESQDFTQSFGVAFRTPTGSDVNGNHVAAVTPAYEFWSNPWQKLVVRGGVGMFVPYGHDSLDEVGARTAFNANLAAGYYLTEHGTVPFGDLVLYAAASLSTLTDSHGPNTTTLVFTPGLRTHLSCNWYLLAGIDLPATHPEPYSYQPTVGLMKVF